MYSFDVFDTLITRTTATPWGIFALMKDRLLREKQTNGVDDYVIDNFYELRIHSEELSRKAGAFQQIEEVTLHDIYRAMAVCGCIDDKQIEYLCQLEQETEISNVVPVPENIHRLKGLMEKGERVVLISDMYLPGATIRKMLLQADAVFETVPLYVSSDYGKRKTTGNLYRLVKELEQIDYGEWIHIGDNVYQDIEVCFQLGIQPELVERSELNDFEKELLENYGDDSRLQMLIGTAVRTDKSGEDFCENVSENAYHIGSRYAAPVLYSYSEWIVSQAVKKNIRRLYFIARDGYLVKRIVEIILQKKKLDIESKYIYGSRAAWRMPSLSKEHYNLYQLVLWSHVHRITTLDELATVLHLTRQELYEYLPGTYAQNKENVHIYGREVEYIVRKLSANERFRDYHLKQLENERKLAQKYLEQEVDVTGGQFAFVDVSGGGLTQGCLRELLKNRYAEPIHTFFFKIDRVNLAEGSVTDTYMPGFLENNLTIEMMCRAPHGQTKGYTIENGKIKAVLEEVESRPLLEHGFYEYEMGIADFSEKMCEVSLNMGMEVGSMRNVLFYLKHIAGEPSEDVLEYFASMPSSETGRGKEIVEYAPRLTKDEIKNIFLKRTDERIELFYKGTDLSYSVMRATDSERELIERYKREHNGTLGRLYRQEAEKEWQEMRRRYGRAAFYPVRLLEERVVLYGAGKFGQDLYNRLTEDKEHEVILWVDKNAEACRGRGLANVHEVSGIKDVDYDQVVIAVMDENLADTIQNELEQTGLSRERIVWIPANLQGEWDTKEIG